MGNLRFFPAFFSALTVPVIYQIMVELRATRWTATLAASLFILGILIHIGNILPRSQSFFENTEMTQRISMEGLHSGFPASGKVRENQGFSEKSGNLLRVRESQGILL